MSVSKNTSVEALLRFIERGATFSLPFPILLPKTEVPTQEKSDLRVIQGKRPLSHAARTGDRIVCYGRFSPIP